jgi:hypothetical protein
MRILEFVLFLNLVDVTTKHFTDPFGILAGLHGQLNRISFGDILVFRSKIAGLRKHNSSVALAMDWGIAQKLNTLCSCKPARYHKQSLEFLRTSKTISELQLNANSRFSGSNRSPKLSMCLDQISLGQKRRPSS